MKSNNEPLWRKNSPKQFLKLRKKRILSQKLLRKTYKSKPELTKLAKTTQDKFDSVSKKFELAKKRELSMYLLNYLKLNLQFQKLNQKQEK